VELGFGATTDPCLQSISFLLFLVMIVAAAA